MLAFSQKAGQPRLRLWDRVRAGHADDVEALLAREVDEPGLAGGGVL
jgi:hypothetical protein